MSDVEDNVRSFYDNVGWNKNSDINEDTLFREHSRDYNEYMIGVASRTEELFSGIGGDLLIVGCGDLPESHIKISQKFATTTCLDISKAALKLAAGKLETKNSKFVLGSALEAPFETGTFDAILCAHVLYHIDQSLQERAVREMLRVLKPKGKLVVVYVNHRSLPNYFLKLRALFAKPAPPPATADLPGNTDIGLYFFAHHLSFWRKFRNEAMIELHSWSIVSLQQERNLFPSGRGRKAFFAFASRVERTLPWVSARLWRYVMPVLIKK